MTGWRRAEWVVRDGKIVGKKGGEPDGWGREG